MDVVKKFSFVCLVLFWVVLGQEGSKKPNIVFILTDDQDVLLDGMVPMAKTRQLFYEKGVTFKNMFATTPICCPSRSSILTGRYVHSHRTVNNSFSGNCSSHHWQQGPEKETFAHILHSKANYTTFFGGKYLNVYGHKKAGGVKHVPPGWDSWNGLVGNSVYYNYTLSVNGHAERHMDNPSADYLTNVLKRQALNFLDEYDPDKSFFMMISTPACHAPFTPEPKYENKYGDRSPPRTPNYFKYSGEDKHWLLRQVPKTMPKSVLNFTDNTYKQRLRTLLTVDDLVHDVYAKLQEKSLAENTYIFFSSDNGFHLGQFSLPYDKRQMYEFDIRVPLLVLGPGIPTSLTRPEPVLNIDLAPTFLDLAGIELPKKMDGVSIAPLLRRPDESFQSDWRSSFQVEYVGEHNLFNRDCPQYDNQNMANCFPECICEDTKNNTYSCIRTMTNVKNTIICHFKDDENFVEAYDIAVDPYQMRNLAYDFTTNQTNPHFKFKNYCN